MGTLLRKLLIPGFVPLSQGNKFIGILWMLGALSGYGWFIVPGLIIHFIYIYKYCWKEVKLLIKGNKNAEHLASQVEQIAQKQSENIKKIQAVGEQSSFEDAIEFANNQKFDKAIVILEKIPANSELYTEAQAKISEYRIKSQQNELDKAIELANNNNFEKAIVILKKIPTSSEIYQQAQDKITEYQNQIEEEKKKKVLQAQQQELDKAIELANNNNFEKAITTLEKIPTNSELYTEAQAKISEYRIKSQQNELDKAIELANNNNFEKAITTLEKIPANSELYTEAQDKITEYRNQIEDEKKRKLLEAQKHDLNTAINLANFNRFAEAISTLEKIPANSEIYQQAQDKITEYQHKIEEERKKRQAEAGGRAIEVIQIFQQNGLSTKNPICETINGRIIVVMINLSNTSKKSGNFLFSQFQLIDSDKCVYNELSDMTYTMWRQEKGFGLRSDDYFPGEIRQDAAAFRVSPTAKDFTLKWNGKTIKLWL
jgi:ribosomal protein S21